jgi:hypothetical protein
MLQALFIASIVLAVPFWVLIIVFPRLRITQNIPLLAFPIFGALYIFTLVGALVASIGQVPINFSSLEGLQAMAAVPAVMLVLWIHIVIVDLAAGYWLLYESQAYEMPRLTRTVFLILTLLLAPVGLFSFALWRILTGMKMRKPYVPSITRREMGAQPANK